jgi:hypothetical protein
MDSQQCRYLTSMTSHRVFGYVLKRFSPGITETEVGHSRGKVIDSVVEEAVVRRTVV